MCVCAFQQKLAKLALSRTTWGCFFFVLAAQSRPDIRQERDPYWRGVDFLPSINFTSRISLCWVGCSEVRWLILRSAWGVRLTAALFRSAVDIIASIVGDMPSTNHGRRGEAQAFLGREIPSRKMTCRGTITIFVGFHKDRLQRPLIQLPASF
ncbi:hypothetical protein F5X96DRAFT_507422 [Biscogniauxia mediterranea]|nr:hypothetical protein F5X96DRAFT_507422 [Biscogniauxia mediterranea]